MPSRKRGTWILPTTTNGRIQTCSDRCRIVLLRAACCDVGRGPPARAGFTRGRIGAPTASPLSAWACAGPTIVTNNLPSTSPLIKWGDEYLSVEDRGIGKGPESCFL